jgi:hypothetical protein
MFIGKRAMNCVEPIQGIANVITKLLLVLARRLLPSDKVSKKAVHGGRQISREIPCLFDIQLAQGQVERSFLPVVSASGLHASSSYAHSMRIVRKSLVKQKSWISAKHTNGATDDRGRL